MKVEPLGRSRPVESYPECLEGVLSLRMDGCCVAALVAVAVPPLMPPAS